MASSSSTENEHRLDLVENGVLGEDYGEDLEKQVTVENKPISVVRQRVSRMSSLTGAKKQEFSHPFGHLQTTEADIVTFDGDDDPYRPINWPLRKKAITTLLYGLTTMGVTFSSGILAPATDQLAAEYGIDKEVANLGVTVYMIGFGFGPLIFAPLSEVYGRKSAAVTPYFIAACFSFGAAASQSVSAILVCRFFAGLFGSAPATNTGGVLGDIWSPQQRGTALVFYAFSVVAGPTVGVVVAAAIVQSHLRWRWTQYISGIYLLTVLALDIIILDECYPPALLVAKARRLRYETSNWALHAKHEEWDVSFKQMAAKFGARPFQLLLTPICLCVATYAAFTGWDPVQAQLPFLAFLLGSILGGMANIFNNKFYIRKFIANGNKPVPEARLPPMMVGSVFFAAGLFIFGWCSDPSIFWLAPVTGVLFLGFGFFTIFQAALNYLIDCFQIYAASAIAAKTFLRSAFAATFPLFATPLYTKLGIPVASSVLGGIATLMIAIPFVFHISGPSIRKRGRWTASLT